MAKLVKTIKGYQIKATTPRDETSYKYWIVKDGQVEWEADSMKECIEWIG